MTTSRTGTSSWLKVRKRALAQAQAAGQERCPYCRCLLNYSVGRLPESAEVDHITAYAAGGSDTMENVQVVCRACNQSKGARSAPRAKSVQKRVPLTTSRAW